MSREFFKYFFAAVGTISSVVTLISFVFQLTKPNCLIVVLYVVAIIGMSVAFAVWQTWRKKTITIKISNTLTTCVKAGDLFDYAKNGNYVIIPVNEYFDTLVDDTIINKGSIHGQFVERYYPNNHKQLHEEIEHFFELNKIKGEKVTREDSEGYSTKYPIGTCALIDKNDTHFVLLALTHFDNKEQAYVELSEFGRCISRMCTFLCTRVGQQPVYMPLMGMGLSRLNQSGQFILKYMLDTIVGIKNLAILGGLNIIIYPTIAKTINLNEIKY